MAARRGKIYTSTDDFQLVIPERGERVKIRLGSTATVSCHLSPAISAVDMQITWYNESSCVCAYKSRKMTQGVGFEGRASLFIHDLKRGSVSLRVTNFTQSDLGVYVCQVTSRNNTQQITVNVAEEVKDQNVFTVDYKKEEATADKSPNVYTNDSDKSLQETGKPSFKLSIHSACHRASGKDKDYEGETNRESSSQASYHNKSKRSQHGDSKMEASRNNNFQLVVPSKAQDPVSLGSDFIVPCFSSPEISAVEMEIRWSNDTDCVCLYKDRQVTEGVWFKDRVCLFSSLNLKKGNVSLRLKNFRLSDIGNYHCQVISKDRKEEITVRVRVNPDVQPVSQSPIHRDADAQIMPSEDTKTGEATNKFSRHISRHIDSDKKQDDYSRGFPSDDFQLVIPQTTLANISMGSEFIVPCYSSPEICATDMQIKWFRETDCVCVYKNRHVMEGRSHRDRASLVAHELERGDVSLHLRNFSVSDVGDFHCQVTSKDRTKEITVGVRIKPEVQSEIQSPTYQGQYIQLTLLKMDRIWTEDETDKMDESALMAEMKVDSVQELQRMLIKTCKEKDRQLERTERELRETRKDLDRVLKLNPHSQFLDRDKPNPF